MSRKKDGKAGYKNPPKEHQFKKGQSGNPTGRPKGSRSISSIYQEKLDEQIEINERGKSKKISYKEAVVHRVAIDAVKGKAYAVERIHSMLPPVILKEAEPEELNIFTEENIDVLNAEELKAFCNIIKKLEKEAQRRRDEKEKRDKRRI